MRSKIFMMVSMAILTMFGLTSCQQQSNLSLTDVEWHLVALDGAEVAVAEDTFNLKLSKEGFLSGIGACNRLLGRYNADDKGELRFVNVGSTMMLCPENGELEQKFLAALNATNRYAIVGDKLSLMADDVVKAVMKGKANEGVCPNSCPQAADCPKKADCPKAADCQKQCCPQHCCPKGKDCPKAESCEKRANCPQAADCPKKADCPKVANCPKAADCPKVADCPKAADCPKTENCPTKANCPKVANCPKAADCQKAADCPKTENCPTKANCPKVANCPKAK